MFTTKIIRILSEQEYKYLLKESDIKVGKHALDHLSEAQRKIYNPEELINTLLRDNPELIGYQLNGRYCVYFRKKGYYLKIVFALNNTVIEIITFMNSDKVPKVD